MEGRSGSAWHRRGPSISAGRPYPGAMWPFRTKPVPLPTEPCTCPRHLDEALLSSVVPVAPRWAEEVSEEPVTIADLIDTGALEASPLDRSRASEAHLVEDGYQFTAWVGDEARLHYDDDAPLDLESALRSQPGVELVMWEDREILHVGAPSLCADGVLVAVATALLDPRVRG